MSEAKAVVSKAGMSMRQRNESMAEISSSGQEIGKIVKTIDEIAFKSIC
jgi:methyl-accepting chemotaxis protein